MASRPTLSTFATEIVETIVTFLDLPDICNLRQAAREISEKASQGVFRIHFRYKQVRLTKDELEHAKSIARQRQYAHPLQHLTLVGIPTSVPLNSATEPERQLERRSIQLKLNHVLNLFCLNSACGVLPRISLVVEGAGEDGPHRPRIWDAAASCFHVTMLALSHSQLPVRSLDVFGSVDCCSLGCDQVAAMLATADIPVLANSLRGLKQLFLSLSFHEKRNPENEHMQTSAFGRANTQSVVQFLELCPTLEDLQLHWYQTYPTSGLTNALSEENFFFDGIAKACQFPKLTKCTLKGLNTSEAALMSFLGQVPQLRFLHMDYINISTRGRFKPVFEHLSNNSPQLEHLHLDNMFEGKLIDFKAPGQPHFPCTGRGPSGPNMITRTNAEVRQPLEYFCRRGRALGSVQSNRWLRENRHQYGPSKPDL